MRFIYNWANAEFLLIFYIFFAFVGLQPFSIGVDELNPTTNDVSVLRRIIYISFLLVSFSIFLKMRYSFFYVWKIYWAFISFSLFLLLSAFWSVAPEVTFVRASLYVVSLFTIVFLVLAINVDRFLRALAFLFGWLLVVSFISIFVLPSATHQVAELAGYWRGIYSHKNNAGLAMVISILLFARSYLDSKEKFWIVLIFLASVFLYFTGSKTSLGFSIIALLIGLFFYMSRKYFVLSKIYQTSLFVFFAFLIFSIYFFQINLDLFLGWLLYDPEGFTGRVLIWDYLINMINDRPLLGFGFGAVWGMGENSYLYDYATNNSQWVYNMTHGHNSYLDLIVMVGFIGLLFFSLIYIFPSIFFISQNYRLKNDFLFVFYGFLFFMLFHSLLETNFLLVDQGRWVVFQVFVLIRARLVFESRYN